MKRSLLLGFLVLLTSGVFAAEKVDLAFGPLISWEQSLSKSNAGGPVIQTNDMTIRLGLVVPIFLAGGFEVDPEVVLIQESNKVENITASTVTSEMTQGKISLGAGAYWTMITAGQMSFKTGVKGMFTLGNKPTAAPLEFTNYMDLGADLSMPLILDFGLSKNLYIRMSQDIATASWHGLASTQGAIEKSENTFVLKTLYQGFTPLFALYWKL